MIETPATNLLRRGPRANQPAPSLVVLGTLYRVTDEALVEQAIGSEIDESSVANPTEITTFNPHGLTTGDSVLIIGHIGSTPDINGVHTVTVLDDVTFTITEDVTVAGTSGIVYAWVLWSED